MNSVLKNVIAIYVAKSSDLDGMVLTKPGKVKLPDNVTWTLVMIQVPGKLTIIDKVEDKNKVYTSTLSFRTCDHLPDYGHNVYKVALADGRQLLLGSADRPYPVTTISESMPDNFTDSQLNEVTVTLTSKARPPQIV